MLLTSRISCSSKWLWPRCLVRVHKTVTAKRGRLSLSPAPQQVARRPVQRPIQDVWHLPQCQYDTADTHAKYNDKKQATRCHTVRLNHAPLVPFLQPPVGIVSKLLIKNDNNGKHPQAEVLLEFMFQFLYNRLVITKFSFLQLTKKKYGYVLVSLLKKKCGSEAVEQTKISGAHTEKRSQKTMFLHPWKEDKKISPYINSLENLNH